MILFLLKLPNSNNVITIQRVGLVISYRYLMDSNNPSTDTIWYNCKSDTCSFNYDYMAGEQIIVYATYYHPSNDRTVMGSNDLSLYLKYDDGTSEILTHTDGSHSFEGYHAENATDIATTSFIIGFVNSKYQEPDTGVWVGNITEQTFSKAGHRGGFSATVLNSGYNAAGSYGGTQVGSGAGVYWDGRISWY